MKRLALAIVLTASLLSALITMAVAQEPQEEQTEQKRLSLRYVLEQAYFYNPDLRAARAELSAAQERLPQAQAGWKPSVSGEAGITATDINGSNFGSASGSTAKDFGVNVTQPVFRGGRTRAQIGAAHHVIAANISAVKDREQNILLQTATIYGDVVRDESLVNLSQNNMEVLAQELKAAKARFEYGELTKTDVAQAEARLARARSEIIAAKAQLQISQSRFTQLTGLAPQGISTLMSAAQDLPETMEGAIDLAMDRNPLMQAAHHTYEAAQKDIDDVFGELLPSVEAFASWQRVFDPVPGLIDEQTSRAVGLSASIPLYQAGATRSRLRQAKHSHNQRFLEIESTRAAVAQEVQQSWMEWKRASSEIDSRLSEVSAATLAEEGVRKESEFGSRTVLDLLDAQQELLDAQTALVSAQRDQAVARFSLLKVLGSLTPELLEFESAAIDYDSHLNAIQRHIFKTHVDRLR